MKANIYTLEGKKKGSLNLPAPFDEDIRPDLIHRAVVSMQSNRRQPYGPSPEAGMRHATSQAGKGRGIARVQRMTQYRNRAAESPNNVGGRRAHPPKIEKKLGKKLNKKEKRKARRSALAATSQMNLVMGRGHKIDDEKITLPIVLEKGVEDIEKTEDAVDILEKLGVYSDVQRACDGVKIRAGKGTMRGRKYKIPKSILVVLPKGSKSVQAFSNLNGVDIKDPDTVTVEDLAPGGDMGRLILCSVKALNQMGDW